MPTTPAYPGVYIEEMPHGDQPISGVPASITAFLGRASWGPVNEPTLINSFAEFERQFGGLGINFPLSYAVRDFYNNGGQQAVIVRLYKAQDPDGDAKARLAVDCLDVCAKYPGALGKKLRATIDVEVADDMWAELGLNLSEALFNLTIRLESRVEKLYNLTVTDNERRIDRVLEAESSLVQWRGGWPDSGPSLTGINTAREAYRNYAKTINDAHPDRVGMAVSKKAYDDAKRCLSDAATIAENKRRAARAAVPPLVTGVVEEAEAEIETAENGMQGSDGGDLDQVAYLGSREKMTGLYALDKADLFNILCIPPDRRDGDTALGVYQTAMAYCWERRAMLIVDPPAEWSNNKETFFAALQIKLAGLGLSGKAARNAALYFPRVLEADPLRQGQTGTFVPCGIIAGIMAKTDAARGVWKAPAGQDAVIKGTQGLSVHLNDEENGVLNPLGINCLRTFSEKGNVVWGARTLRGADYLADEYKYIPVRRTALFIEESIYRGTQWAVFEPNGASTWAKIRSGIGAFMNDLFRQGAFQGAAPREAYFVKCDAETTSAADICDGVINIVIGFAPLKPAEFLIITIQQKTVPTED